MDSAMNRRLLSSGVYSIPQAAKLLGISSAKVRFWITGHPKMQSAPIVQSEHKPIDHQIAISFLNLMEVRFIDAFSKYGLSVRSIRYMADEARRFLRHPHPFATDMMFRTDGRRIFIETAEKTEDPKLYDLKGKNWGIHQVLMEALKKDVLYGPSGIAQAWYPRRDIAPDVVLHPKISFGHPALIDSGIPTEALYDAYRADGDSYKSVSRWFGIPVEKVKEAVDFECDLRNLH
jgi:uncharacterized protein (DUF433 family)